MLSTNAHPSDALSDEAYSTLVDSLIDDEDDVEASSVGDHKTQVMKKTQFGSLFLLLYVDISFNCIY